MINVGVVLLITLAIILTIIFIVLITWATISYILDTSSATGATALAPCSSNINLSSLIQIPNTGSNCIQNGLTTSLYYIGQLSPQTYDYVVAPWGTQPFDVCIGFCTGYTGGVCSGSSYNGKSSQDNFDQCMSQLSSTTCVPPVPIAAKGTTVYYAFSPTCNICDNCGVT